MKCFHRRSYFDEQAGIQDPSPIVDFATLQRLSGKIKASAVRDYLQKKDIKYQMNGDFEPYCTEKNLNDAISREKVRSSFFRPPAPRRTAAA